MWREQKGPSSLPCPLASTDILRSGRLSAGGEEMTHATPLHFHVVWCLLWLEPEVRLTVSTSSFKHSLGVTLGRHPNPCVCQFP